MMKIPTLFLQVLLLTSLSFSAFAQDLLFEYHPNSNGYVLLSSKGIVSKEVPVQFTKDLKKSSGKSGVQAMSFTPDGKGWAIISARKPITHNVEGGYTAALKKLRAKKVKIKSVAFNPLGWDSKHGFIIVHKGGYVAEGIPPSLKIQLDKIISQSHGISAVKFTPDGGWSVRSAFYEWSRMIQGKAVKENFVDRLRRMYLEGKIVHAVSFNPSNYPKDFGWIIITNEGYDGDVIPESLQKSLQKLSIKKIAH